MVISVVAKFILKALCLAADFLIVYNEQIAKQFLIAMCNLELVFLKKKNCETHTQKAAILTLLIYSNTQIAWIVIQMTKDQDRDRATLRHTNRNLKYSSFFGGFSFC